VDAWVERAMQRWPNVPALFGWLGLDRRGRWLIKGEPITHPRIIDTISRNYAADALGRWYFQNGPQRGYMQLEYAPLILRTAEGGTTLITHTGLRVERLVKAFLDEEGAVLLLTEHGPGEVLSTELDWILQRLRYDGQSINEEHLVDALTLPSGKATHILFDAGNSLLPLMRLDAAAAPEALNFVREPQPRSGETSSTRAPD
jgi:hypothetical protein